MCETCIAEAEDLGALIPGWRVIRVQRASAHMCAGEVGIVEDDGGPFIIFSFAPRPDPLGGWSDDEVDGTTAAEWLAYQDWSADSSALIQAFKNEDMDARATWRLVEAARKAGYRPDDDEAVELWIVDRVGRLLAGQPLTPQPRSVAEKPPAA